MFAATPLTRHGGPLRVMRLILEMGVVGGATVRRAKPRGVEPSPVRNYVAAGPGNVA